MKYEIGDVMVNDGTVEVTVCSWEDFVQFSDRTHIAPKEHYCPNGFACFDRKGEYSYYPEETIKTLQIRKLTPLEKAML